MTTLREIDELPAPKGWPLVGNALQIKRGQMHQTVEAWGREHGPLFRMRFMSRIWLGVTDTDAVTAALRDRPDGFRRTQLMETIGLEMGMTPGVFAANGEAWRRQRRMVMAGFDPTHVRAYFPSLLKGAQRLRGRWLKAASAGASIELQPELMRYTVDAISGLAFGVEVNTLESDDEIIQRHLDKIFPALQKRLFSIIPWWRLVRSPADRQLERSMAAVNQAIAGFIAQARTRLAAEPARRAQPPNLLEAMIVAADAGDSGLDDRDVHGNVLTMLLAGEDTTANTLAWMIYLLHRHPAALQRAQQEVRALAPDVAAFTPDALASLDYLEACAHETMRLKPIAPFNVIEALRDTEIKGVRVPKGTLVWCVLRHDSVDAQQLPNAQAFEPERWLAGSASAGTAKRLSMPFGAGPRICPGRYLALLEIKMAMAMLLTHFDIEQVGTADGAEPAEQMSFTMMPVGLRMTLSARAQPAPPAPVPSP
ncbi:MAG TPA: cytochrome P450 [Burkholderiaceae bacterium]|jgi:cytochrome P450